MPGFIGVDPGGAGNIEVDPGCDGGSRWGGDELLEEHGGSDGAAVAAVAGVLNVGDGTFDLVAVVIGAGKAPELFAGSAGGSEKAVSGEVIVGKEAGVELAEGDADGTGERSRVDQVGGAELLSVVEAISENEAAFGIGVENFDRFAGHSGKDVSGFVGAGVGHIFRRANDAKDAHGGFKVRDGLHGTEHCGRTGHVVLHFVHVVGGLDGDAAGVEGDAFANEAEDGSVGRRWEFGFVTEDDEGGRFGGALGNGSEGTHAEFVKLVGGVDLAGEAAGGGHGSGATAELCGCEDVAGLVDERAGKVLCFTEDNALVEALPNFRLGFAVGFGAEDREGLEGGVFAVGAVGIDVEGGEEGAFEEGTGGQFTG